MLKSLIAATLAVAMAMGTTAAPAHADRAETVRTIVGVAALALLANELAKQRGKARIEVHRGGRGDWRDRGHDWRDGQGRGDWRDGIRALPASCAFRIRDPRGRDSIVLERGCLQHRYVGAHRLPRDCAFEVKARKRWTEVYGLRCLERAGYHVEARR